MAHQDNAPNKPVHLIYLFGGVLCFFLLKWTGDWIWGFFSQTPSEFVLTTGALIVCIVGGLYLYHHEAAYNLVDEVTAELKKVTWPTAKEVKAATIVVIIMAIISSIILGIFDLIWSNVTNLIYGG